MSLTRGCVLDVANQVGGAMPSVVTLHDWSRYKNDGALTDVTWIQGHTDLWVPVFNGTSSRSIHTSYFGDTDMKTVPFTIEYWGRLTTLGTHSMAVAIRGTTGTYFGVQSRIYSLTDRPCFGFFRNDANVAGRVGFTLATAFTINVWSHIMLTYDGSGAPAANTTCLAYFNGVADTLSALTSFDTWATLGNNEIGLGIAGASWWVGNLRARIYNYEFTPAQVRARYHSTKWLFGVAS